LQSSAREKRDRWMNIAREILQWSCGECWTAYNGIAADSGMQAINGDATF